MAASVTGKEAEIILPPPSEKNPIPSLTAALRVDNQEQLLSLLLDRPDDFAGSLPHDAANFRQLLVFGSDSLRTLLMRQVLTDPHTRAWKNQQTRWDGATTFPGMPRSLNVAGTAILGDTTETVTADVVTYFLRTTDLQQTQLAADFIFKCKNRSTHHRLVYLPQTPAIVQKMLLNMGLTGPSSTKSVSLHALQLDLFPIEPDVLSMEFADAFRELHVEGTPSTVITDVARSILKLQDIVGTIPRVQAYGVAAEHVLRKMLDLAVEEHLANPLPEEQVASESVAALVILDRKIDMVTPLVTSLTYEGLLDDLVGIDCGFLTVGVDILNPPEEAEVMEKVASKKKEDTGTELVMLAINESDSLFSEIRNQHVEQFGSYLQNQAKAMQATQNDFKETGKHKELSELHKFVKQLPGFKQKFQSLSTHIYLAELIKYTSEEAIFRERWRMERTMLEGDLCLDELDDLVACSYPAYRFLRLLCLQSLCKNGISSSRYDSLRKDTVQTYGYEFLSVLVNFEKAGLLRRKEAFLGMEKPSSFSKLTESLVLINAEVDTVEPDDISYISSGYAPLTVRLVQSAVSGWKNGRDDILRELSGRFFDVVQQYPPEDLGTTMKRPISTGSTYGSLALPTSTESNKKPVLVIVYVGGVTYMELAALRFLSKRLSFPYQIIICTTKIINGNTILQSLA
jgi:hypothetical protein